MADKKGGKGGKKGGKKGQKGNRLCPGRVVVVLAGRFAGKKAVITNIVPQTAHYKYLRVQLAGLSQSPRRVTRSMKEQKVAKRTRCRAFVHTMNVGHCLPTRFVMDLNFQKQVKLDKDHIGTVDKKKAAVDKLSNWFTKEFKQNGKKTNATDFFFSKLNF